MKRIYIAFFALMATTFCACSETPSASAPVAASPASSPMATVTAMNTAEMEKMIIELEKKIWELYINKKIAEVKPYYLPEYRAIYYGTIKTLEENLKDANEIETKNFSMSDVKATFPVKDTALLTYRYSATSTYKGKTTSGTMVGSSVWVNKDGGWKCALYTETIAEPQPKK